MPVSVDEARTRLAEVGQWIDEFRTDHDLGVELIYVFDTDIMVQYSDPRRMSSYCALLRSEASARLDRANANNSKPGSIVEAEVMLADIIGNYVVWGRGDKRPALTSPAHLEELANVVDAVFMAASRQVENLRDVLRGEFELLSRELDSGSPAQGAKPEIGPAINDLLNRLQHSHGQVMAALRWSPAFEQGRIFSVDHFRFDDSPTRADQGFLPSAQDPATGDFRSEILAIAERIEKILVASGNASASRRTVWRADSRALAHLCWLNQQLEVAGTKLRVRFVTGAAHLHQLRSLSSAWVKRLPLGIAKDYEGLQGAFIELIRHPMGFLDDSGLQPLFGLRGADANEGGKLGVWLRDRLSLERPGPGHADKLSLPDDEQLLLRASEELQELLVAAKARQTITPDRSWLESLVHKAIDSHREEWAEILDRNIQGVLPHFLASLATLQTPAGPQRMIARNLPPLQFAKFKACEAFCLDLYLAHSSNDFRPDRIRQKLAPVIAEDPTLYTPLIAIAMWRAAERDWQRARIMAWGAVQVAERHVRSVHAAPALASMSNGIFGEEAAYLFAVTLRLTAGRGQPHTDFEEDLKRAETMLDFAEEQKCRFDTESGRAQVGSGAPDPRIVAERISLLLTRRLSNRLANKRIDSPTDVDVFDRGWSQYQNLQTWREQSPNHMYAIEYVEQQLLTSMAHAVLLDRYGVVGTEVFPILDTTWSESAQYADRVKQLWELLNAQCARLEPPHEGQPLPVLSSLVQGTWLVLDLEIRRPKLSVKERTQFRRKVESCLDPQHLVAAIDELRFNFLRKIAMRHLGAV